MGWLRRCVLHQAQRKFHVPCCLSLLLTQDSSLLLLLLLKSLDLLVVYCFDTFYLQLTLALCASFFYRSWQDGVCAQRRIRTATFAGISRVPRSPFLHACLCTRYLSPYCMLFSARLLSSCYCFPSQAVHGGTALPRTLNPFRTRNSH